MIKKKEKNKWQMLLTRKIPYRRSSSIYKGKRNSVETPWGVWKRYELFGEFHFAFNFLVAIVMKFQERGIEDISTEPSLISFIPQSRSSKLSLSSAELEHISFWWELFWDAVESILCLDLRGKASSDIIKKNLCTYKAVSTTEQRKDKYPLLHTIHRRIFVSCSADLRNRVRDHSSSFGDSYTNMALLLNFSSKQSAKDTRRYISRQQLRRTLIFAQWIQKIFPHWLPVYVRDMNPLDKRARSQKVCWSIKESMSFDKCSQYQPFCVSIGEVTTSNKRARSQEFI